MKKKFKDVIDTFKYIGPGILVTIGFIDPGNWASNMAAGSEYGYKLLWTVTLSTIMLIVLQHNAAHLGIVTGKCIAESTTENIPKKYALPILSTAILASIATAMAEILGAGIGLQLLFNIPIIIGSIITTVVIIIVNLTNTYRNIEKAIIVFVSIIGLSFLFELFLADVIWPEAIKAAVTVSIPHGSMLIIMSVLGAVVMPHNLFLHSETIQSQRIPEMGEQTIKRRLDYEFTDTIFSMVIGWAINSSMIILAAEFFKKGIKVTELGQAKEMLVPLLGRNASLVFAIALLFSGISSSITAAMAGGSIFSGVFGKEYNIKSSVTRLGIVITAGAGLLVIFFVGDPFKGLVISQMLLSVQLPITIFLQIYLTSSKKIMGKYRNSRLMSISLWVIGAIVSGLNIMLLISALS